VPCLYLWVYLHKCFFFGTLSILCVCEIWYICTVYFNSNIAVMDENSKATFQDGVQFRIESVPSLDYHVKDPAQPE